MDSGKAATSILMFLFGINDHQTHTGYLCKQDRIAISTSQGKNFINQHINQIIKKNGLPILIKEGNNYWWGFYHATKSSTDKDFIYTCVLIDSKTGIVIDQKFSENPDLAGAYSNLFKAQIEKIKRLN